MIGIFIDLLAAIIAIGLFYLYLFHKEILIMTLILSGSVLIVVGFPWMVVSGHLEPHPFIGKALFYSIGAAAYCSVGVNFFLIFKQGRKHE